MIPRCKDWSVRVLKQGSMPEVRLTITAPTKLLAKLSFRHDYPAYWSRNFKVSYRRH